jgi:tetratricopeptide (TPR) repeat protein
MASNRNVYVRRAIGFVLGAAAAITLTLPVLAQSTAQGRAQDTAQSKAQATAGSQSGTAGKDSGGVLGGVPNGEKGGVAGDADLLKAIAWGKAYGVAAGAGGFDAYQEGALELLAQAKDYSAAAAGWADSARELKYEALYDYDGALFGFQDGEKLKDKEKDFEKEREKERADREDQIYNEGLRFRDEGKLDRAVDIFDQVAEMKLKRADAALYWKAWSQNKLGHRTESLATLGQLQHDYPQSRWLNDAKALDVEVRQSSGQPVSPDAESDCELKLLAINGLQQADPAKAVPLLEKMLHSTDCIKLHRQALFVLAQSHSPEAQSVIAKLARGDSNPDLQRSAIQDLGMYGGSTGRDTLEQIYTSTTDVDTKISILRALMMTGDRGRILNAARGEKTPELRGEAIRQLGMMGDREDIWQLYQSETSPEVKKVILQMMWQSGDVDHVSQLALTEKDHSLRISAINDLGMMGSRSGTKNEETLLTIYSSDTDPEIRQKVINALAMTNDAKALVTIARKETDPTLKKSIVSKLSIMKSPDATAYLLELLNK